MLGTQEEFEQVVNEAKIVYNIKDTDTKNVIKCYDFFTQNILNTPFFVIVTEFCEVTNANVSFYFMYCIIKHHIDLN
jgi:hypothetical protein